MKIKDLFNHGNQFPKAGNPRNKGELIKILEKQSFKVLMAEEGRPKDIAKFVEKVTSNHVTILVLE